MESKKHTENQPINDPDPTCERPAPEAETDNVADESFEATDNLSESDAVDWQDKYLRLQAEFDNYRKRTLREKLEIAAAGGESVIRDLLAVMDDFDRALAAMQSALDVASVRQGVELIRQKFLDALRSKGLSEIDARGHALDTDYHEAVTTFPVEEAERKGRVIDVVQKGYKLNDKVVRHAKVVVGE